MRINNTDVPFDVYRLNMIFYAKCAFYVFQQIS